MFVFIGCGWCVFESCFVEESEEYSNFVIGAVGTRLFWCVGVVRLIVGYGVMSVVGLFRIISALERANVFLLVVLFVIYYYLYIFERDSDV